jgi:hypothetical protein
MELLVLPLVCILRVYDMSPFEYIALNKRG